MVYSNPEFRNKVIAFITHILDDKFVENFEIIRSITHSYDEYTFRNDNHAGSLLDVWHTHKLITNSYTDEDAFSVCLDNLNIMNFHNMNEMYVVTPFTDLDDFDAVLFQYSTNASEEIAVMLTYISYFAGYVKDRSDIKVIALSFNVFLKYIDLIDNYMKIWGK